MTAPVATSTGADTDTPLLGLPRVRERRLKVFQPLLDDPNQAMFVDDLVEVAALAASIDGRPNVRSALFRIRNAAGPVQIHMAWQLLAAHALKMADATRPRKRSGRR